MKTRDGICLVSLLCVLSSCGVRVISNHKKIPVTSLPVFDSSIFVVGRFDHIKIGPDARLISKIHVKGPWQGGLPVMKHYSSLKDLAVRESTLLGGNVVVIKKYHNLYTSSHLSSDIVADVYDVSGPGINDLKFQQAANRAAHDDSLKNNCTVHIQFGGRGVIDVFFNDRLALYDKNQHNPPQGFVGFAVKNDVYNFSWTEPGEFAVRSHLSDSGGAKHALKTGNEYFFFAMTFGDGRVFLMDLTKDQFENELFRPGKIRNMATQ